MATIYDMLEQDHAKVKQQITKILDSSEGAERTRGRLFEEIRQELEVHTRFEEETFYPAARKIAELKDDVKDALEEHREAKSMLKELSDMEKGSDEFRSRLEELKDALEHHIKDEEQDMFPVARKALDEDDARKMADDYRAMKKREIHKAA